MFLAEPPDADFLGRPYGIDGDGELIAAIDAAGFAVDLDEAEDVLDLGALVGLRG